MFVESLAKLKSKFMDNPKLGGTDLADCKQIWNKLKEEKFKKLTPIVFQSLPKFQNMTGMKCKDLFLENDNSLTQMANSIPISFYNIAGKNILINSDYLGGYRLSTICVLNKNCVCKSLDMGMFDFMTPIIEIDNEYFLLDYTEGLKGKISFSATYLNLNNTENRKRCYFSFE